MNLKNVTKLLASFYVYVDEKPLTQEDQWCCRLQGLRNTLRVMDFFSKLKAIHDYILLKFREDKQDYKTVHDRDLRYWAYEINNKVKTTAFKASTFWLLRFKTGNRIVSCKICRAVTPQLVRKNHGRSPIVCYKCKQKRMSFYRMSTTLINQACNLKCILAGLLPSMDQSKSQPKFSLLFQ